MDVARWCSRFAGLPARIEPGDQVSRLLASPEGEAFLLDHLVCGFHHGLYVWAARPAPDWLRNAHDTLRRTAITRKAGLADLARSVGVTPGHLARAWRAHFGETPAASRSRLKLEHARRLLAADPGLEVRQVAVQAGFTSLATFSRRFRARFGCPPGAVRRRVSAGPGR